MPLYFASRPISETRSEPARASHSNSRSLRRLGKQFQLRRAEVVGGEPLESFVAGKLQGVGVGGPHGDQPFVVGGAAETKRRQMIDPQLLQRRGRRVAAP